MVFPTQHFIKTKSFITNLIEEGRVDEANQLLELGSKGLVKRSHTQSEIGRIIASDLIELERLSLCVTSLLLSSLLCYHL